jgi:hypothetical protein
MSLWPEHHHCRARLLALRRQAACEALGRGPDKDAPIRALTLGVAGHRHRFPEARLKYHPGPDKPTHILVWTPQLSLVVDYHDVDHVVWDEEA